MSTSEATKVNWKLTQTVMAFYKNIYVGFKQEQPEG
jgi:hypothetical protein